MKNTSGMVEDLAACDRKGRQMTGWKYSCTIFVLLRGYLFIYFSLICAFRKHKNVSNVGCWDENQLLADYFCSRSCCCATSFYFARKFWFNLNSYFDMLTLDSVFVGGGGCAGSTLHKFKFEARYLKLWTAGWWWEPLDTILIWFFDLQAWNRTAQKWI